MKTELQPNKNIGIALYGLGAVLFVIATVLQIRHFVSPAYVGGFDPPGSLMLLVSVVSVALGLIADTAGQGERVAVEEVEEPDEPSPFVYECGTTNHRFAGLPGNSLTIDPHEQSGCPMHIHH